MVTRPRPRTGARLLVLALLTAGVALLHPAGPALACDCPEPPPPEEERQRADAVFAGEVTDLVEEGDGPPGPWIDARIEVSEVWEGEIAETVQVRTHAHGATCGYGFESGRTELIYAVEDADGQLTTDLCARTTPVDDAEADLAVLGAGSAPQPGSGIEDGAAPAVAALTAAITAAVVVLLLSTLAIWRRRRRLAAPADGDHGHGVDGPTS